MLRVLTAVFQVKEDSQPIQVLAYDLLRETTIPKVTLFLAETIAAVWPSIFVIPPDAKDEEGTEPIVSSVGGLYFLHGYPCWFQLTLKHLYACFQIR
jgi:hypothetical protein